MFTPFAFVKEAGPSYIGLLDTYPGADAAYSVRRLSGTYNGSAMKIRRDNDNATQDIGFDVSGNLDTGSIATFVGGNSALVDTWYDQSGNGYNLTQATTGNQPRIVNTGTLETVDGIPALRFFGTRYLDNASVTTALPQSLFHVAKANALEAEKVLSDSVTTNQAIFFTDGGNLKIARGTTKATSLSFGTTLNRYLSAILVSGANSDAFNDTTSIMANENVGNNAYNGLRLGANRGTPSVYWDGWMLEFILYPSDESTDRADIVTDITTYY